MKTNSSKRITRPSLPNRVLTGFGLLLALSLCALPALAQSPGSIDHSFRSASYPPDAGHLFGLRMQADGKILVGGFVLDGRTRLGPVFRLNQNGSLDETFTNQFALTGPPCPDSAYQEGLPWGCARSYRLGVDKHGRPLISGTFRTLQGQVRPGLARLTSTGALDLSFAPDLQPLPPHSTSEFAARRVFVVLPDDRIVISELTAGNKLRVQRLLLDGTVDPAFRPPSFGTLDPSHDVFPVLAVQPDGKVLLLARYPDQSDPTPWLFRLNSDGSIDKHFRPFPGNPRALEVHPDGRIMTTEEGGLLRLLSDGSPDPSFALKISFSLFPGLLLLDPAGRPLGVNGGCDGDCDAGVGLQRFHADGTLDATFVRDLPRRTYPTALALQPDGKVLVAGVTNGALSIVRLHGDGAPYLWPHSFKENLDGSIAFLITTSTNRHLVIETSTNLNSGSWTTLVTLPPAVDHMPIPFTDSSNPRSRHRFYRARLSP